LKIESCVICGSNQSHLNNFDLLGLGISQTLERTGFGMINLNPSLTPHISDKHYSNHFFLILIVYITRLPETRFWILTKLCTEWI
jgi:hypothetical protein